MSYREKIQLFQKLQQVMKERKWKEAVGLADALRAAGISDRHWYEAVLSAYIDGNAPEHISEAAEEYVSHFAPTGNIGDWGTMDGVACFYLGRAAYLQGEWPQAKRCFDAALQDTSMPEWYKGAACSIYATLLSRAGDVAAAVPLYLKSSQYKDLAHGKAVEYSNYLFNLHYLMKSPEFMFEAARGFGRLFAGIKPYSFSTRKLARRYHSRQKIRLGYISPDLHFHVVAFFSYAFFHFYDRELFEVYCYTDCVEDAASREFASITDRWRNVRGLTDEQTAAIVHEDEIDILIDLSGHTAWNFLPAMAFKPAPVQVSGIGYFATTGLDTVDYFLADHYTDPEDVPEPNDRWFVERLLRLPHSHFCFMWHDAPDEPAPAPCTKHGYVTFGSLNNFAKVTDDMLAIWAEIMRQVPDSRLYLKTAIFNNPYGRQTVEQRLRRQGIDMERVIIGQHEMKYLHAYNDIDIALDTYPYPGGGTTCDALYMGVPVVTLVGRRHGARFGYSLLMNIGLEELCADSRDEYIAIAVGLAKDKERLRRYHQELRARMQASPVMDSADYMGAVELAYMHIWLERIERELSEAEIAQREAEEQRELEHAYAARNWTQVARLAERIIARYWPDIGAESLSRVYYFAAMGRFECHPANRYELDRAGWWLEQALSLPQTAARELLLARALGDVCVFQTDYRAARAAYERCLAAYERIGDDPTGTVTPDMQAGALAALGHVEGYLGSNEAGRNHYLAAAQIFSSLPQRYGAYSSALLSEHFLAPGDAAGVQAMNELHSGVNELFRNIHRLPALSEAELGAGRHRRLRIGYISGDFRQQVMFYFYYQLLRGHDSEHFELYAYSLGKTHDGFTDSVAAAVEHFVDLSHLARDYEAIARRVRADEIDVLVDLAGHCALSGLPVLAYRPAPVQLSGIGYIHPTGMQAVDGFLTDSYADPPEFAEDWKGLTEKPLRLTSQFCYTGRTDVPRPTAAPCRKNGYITWGVFNRYEKITDDMLALWREIMQAVPDSRLLLKNEIAMAPSGRLLIQQRLRAAGIDVDRVTLEPVSSDYMARYLDVDIALDTYPYVGGGTTCDALYMGVPVVSMYGRRHGTRLGLSILSNAGLGELAAATPAEYVARAVGLAGDRDLLDVLHQNLRQMLLGAPLMDTQRYVGEVEMIYKELWQQKLHSR